MPARGASQRSRSRSRARSKSRARKNSWIQHVSKYARDNNISYGDAITKARASYRKSKRDRY